MRKIKIYVCLVLTLFLLLSMLTPAMATRYYEQNGEVYILYGSGKSNGASDGFPGKGNGVTMDDPDTRQTVSVFPAKGTTSFKPPTFYGQGKGLITVVNTITGETVAATDFLAQEINLDRRLPGRGKLVTRTTYVLFEGCFTNIWGEKVCWKITFTW